MIMIMNCTTYVHVYEISEQNFHFYTMENSQLN